MIYTNKWLKAVICKFPALILYKNDLYQAQELIDDYTDYQFALILYKNDLYPMKIDLMIKFYKKLALILYKNDLYQNEN